jgi:hypothetical protein
MLKGRPVVVPGGGFPYEESYPYEETREAAR